MRGWYAQRNVPNASTIYSCEECGWSKSFTDREMRALIETNPGKRVYEMAHLCKDGKTYTERMAVEAYEEAQRYKSPLTYEEAARAYGRGDLSWEAYRPFKALHDYLGGSNEASQALLRRLAEKGDNADGRERVDTPRAGRPSGFWGWLRDRLLGRGRDVPEVVQSKGDDDEGRSPDSDGDVHDAGPPGPGA